MVYRRLDVTLGAFPEVSRIYRKADDYFADVHCMLKLPHKDIGNAGCNFSSLLVLCSVIDGVSNLIYPTKRIQPDKGDGKRFKKLLRDYFMRHWQKSYNTDVGKFAKKLYVEFRNPLVHQLAHSGLNQRAMDNSEPIVGKWGNIPEDKRDLDNLENLTVAEWPKDWFAFQDSDRNSGPDKVCLVALYWWTKQMMEILSHESDVLRGAEALLAMNPENEPTTSWWDSLRGAIDRLLT